MPDRMDKMYQELKWNYSDLWMEFNVLVTDWHKLEGYVTDSIIRDTINRGNEFWRFWDNHSMHIENGQVTPIRAFVANYIERVEDHFITFTLGNSIQMWTFWGHLLRELEVGTDH